jgi:hypothetical protein
MNQTRIRFGLHARVIRANGWDSIIPCRGKSQPVPNWPAYGSAPASDEQIEAWRVEFSDHNVSLVVNGRVVAFDVDVHPDRFRKLGFTIKDAEREAPALVAKIKSFAADALGPLDFARVGNPPKVMLLYSAADDVPTMAGGSVEVFCTAGSKQVVIGGFHPEAVDEYRWVAPRNPVTHHFDELHPVTAKQAIDFRTEALALCGQAGLTQQPRTTAGNGSGRVSSGIVGDYMSEVLSLIGKAWRQDPREIAADYFRQSVPGDRHYRMVACVGALILRRFTDDEIIAALAPVYRAIVDDDPSISKLHICPRRVRAGMRSRGTNIITLAELDAWLGPNWVLQ